MWYRLYILCSNQGKSHESTGSRHPYDVSFRFILSQWYDISCYWQMCFIVYHMFYLFGFPIWLLNERHLWWHPFSDSNSTSFELLHFRLRVLRVCCFMMMMHDDRAFTQGEAKCLSSFYWVLYYHYHIGITEEFEEHWPRWPPFSFFFFFHGGKPKILSPLIFPLQQGFSKDIDSSKQLPAANNTSHYM